MSEPERASYAYAVARPLDPAALDGLSGVGGHPVHLVTQEDLVAVVSTVPLHEFDEDALKANLEDLRWLEDVARAHHEVIDTVAHHTVVLPLRLATVYHGDDRMRAVLQEGYAAFDRTLERLTGRLEFGVKVYADPSVRRAAAPPPKTAKGESPGKAYLRKRREQRERRDDTWQVAAELVDRADAALREWAEACEQHRPQDASLSGVAGENVLNAAYLVPAEHAEDFLRTVERLRTEAPEGTRIDATGPWAPYSFASPEQSRERA